MLIPSYVSKQGLLEELLDKRILVLDGAMGTMIYAQNPGEEGYRGKRFRNHPKLLKNCTGRHGAHASPSSIEKIHHAYLDAGADIIETDTFNSNRISLAEFSWRNMSSS